MGLYHYWICSKAFDLNFVSSKIKRQNTVISTVLDKQICHSNLHTSQHASRSGSDSNFGSGIGSFFWVNLQLNAVRLDWSELQ